MSAAEKIDPPIPPPQAAWDFDPEFAGPPEWAAMYRACGLQVVPARPPNVDPNKQWKRPMVEWKGLENELIPDLTFERWYGAGGTYAKHKNMGLIMGRCSGGVFVIDLDIYKSKGAEEWWTGLMVIHNFSGELETCEHITGGGGRQLLFSAPEGWIPPTNKTTIGIDLRGQGGFIVCPPSLHTSGKEYAWVPGRAPWEMEIAIAPPWLIEAITQLVTDYGGVTGTSPHEHTPNPGTEFNPFGARIDSRELYMTKLIWADIVGWREECPIRPSDAESSERMTAAFETYCRNVKTRVEGVDLIEGLEREGRGMTAFHTRWVHAMKKWDGAVADAALNDTGPPPPDNDNADRRGNSNAGSEPPESAADAESWDAPPKPPPGGTQQSGGAAQPSLLKWFGDEPLLKPKWLVKWVLPERGVGLIAGQTEAGKTFIGIDLALAVATGGDFAGAQVCRRGGTLWLAAEAEDQVEPRLLGAAAGKFQIFDITDKDLSRRVPFARQRVDVPLLTNPASLPRLLAMAKEADAGMKERFDLPLVLIVFDTVAASAGFNDEDKAAEAQKVMNVMHELARKTGALVIGIDHYGKAVDSGVRGSSAKAASADVILAALGEKSNEGVFKNRRLAVAKLRTGSTGLVVPFELREIDLGDDENTAFIEWQHSSQPENRSTRAWFGKAKILRTAMEVALTDHGRPLRPYGAEGPQVMAVDRQRVRTEFYASYSAEDTRTDTKRRAFTRLIDSAQANRLITARTINDVDWLWFGSKDDERQVA